MNLLHTPFSCGSDRAVGASMARFPRDSGISTTRVCDRGRNRGLWENRSVLKVLGCMGHFPVTASEATRSATLKLNPMGGTR